MKIVLCMLILLSQFAYSKELEVDVFVDVDGSATVLDLNSEVTIVEKLSPAPCDTGKAMVIESIDEFGDKFHVLDSYNCLD